MLTVCGFSGDEIHDSLLVMQADGQLGLFHIHRVTENGFNPCNGNNIGFVDADKLTRRQNILHFSHRLVGDDDMFRRVDLKVVLHAFNINNVRKTDPVKFAVGSDKNIFPY